MIPLGAGVEAELGLELKQSWGDSCTVAPGWQYKGHPNDVHTSLAGPLSLVVEAHIPRSVEFLRGHFRSQDPAGGGMPAHAELHTHPLPAKLDDLELGSLRQLGDNGAFHAQRTLALSVTTKLPVSKGFAVVAGVCGCGAPLMDFTASATAWRTFSS